MAESKKAIEKDVNFQQMMKKNIKYFLYQLVQSNAMNGISSTTEIQTVRTWYQNALTGAETAFAVLTLLFLIMTILKTVKSKKEA
jgi:beta-glucosidase